MGLGGKALLALVVFSTLSFFVADWLLLHEHEAAHAAVCRIVGGNATVRLWAFRGETSCALAGGVPESYVLSNSFIEAVGYQNQAILLFLFLQSTLLGAVLIVLR